jgi:hypothetical protein
MWYNLKCRKCGKIISIELDKNPNCFRSPGFVFSRNDSIHNCNSYDGIEEGEHVYADLFSYSENPLRYADEIISNEMLKERK